MSCLRDAVFELYCEHMLSKTLWAHMLEVSATTNCTSKMGPSSSLSRGWTSKCTKLQQSSSVEQCLSLHISGQMATWENACFIKSKNWLPYSLFPVCFHWSTIITPQSTMPCTFPPRHHPPVKTQTYNSLSQCSQTESHPQNDLSQWSCEHSTSWIKIEVLPLNLACFVWRCRLYRKIYMNRN